MKKQLESLKAEIYSTLGTVNQQKMIHGFESKTKLEQHKIICALPGMSNDVFNYIGYPVQVRVGSGAYGSDTILFRQADGNLIIWENQSFLSLTEEQHEKILPIFKELINIDKTNTTGYSINGGTKIVGFLVECATEDAHSSGITTVITVKDANNNFKEQTVIFG